MTTSKLTTADLLRVKCTKLEYEVASLRNLVEDYHMVVKENKALRDRQEWLEQMVNQLEMAGVARV